MNLIDLIIKFFSGPHMAANTAEFAAQILSQVKTILKSLIILMIGSILFCLIMGYLIDRVLTQMDLGLFTLSSSIIFLLILLVIDIIIIVWSLKQISASEVSKKEPATTNKDDSPLEMALAALILSYVKEREEKMSQTSKQAQTTSQSS